MLFHGWACAHQQPIINIATALGSRVYISVGLVEDQGEAHCIIGEASTVSKYYYGSSDLLEFIVWLRKGLHKVQSEWRMPS
jgi:hypothetical protein